MIVFLLILIFLWIFLELFIVLFIYTFLLSNFLSLLWIEFIEVSKYSLSFSNFCFLLKILISTFFFWSSIDFSSFSFSFSFSFLSLSCFSFWILSNVSFNFAAFFAWSSVLKRVLLITKLSDFDNFFLFTIFFIIFFFFIWGLLFVTSSPLIKTAPRECCRKLSK